MYILRHKEMEPMRQKLKMDMIELPVFCNNNLLGFLGMEKDIGLV